MNSIMKHVLKLCALTFVLGCLTGCIGDMFRNKVEKELISIERYDPHTGKPLKNAEIIDERPIKVRYVVDGKPVVRMEKRTGGFVNAPPLPKEEPKAEIVPDK